jgi:hypothetical protein
MLRGDSTGQGTRGDFKTSLEKARDFHKGGEQSESLPRGGRPPKEKTRRRGFAAHLFLYLREVIVCQDRLWTNVWTNRENGS